MGGLSEQGGRVVVLVQVADSITLLATHVTQPEGAAPTAPPLLLRLRGIFK